MWSPPDVLVFQGQLQLQLQLQLELSVALFSFYPTHPPSGQVVTLTETDLE